MWCSPRSASRSASDEVTREVARRLLAEGTAWMTPSTWHGQAVLRISVSNWRTGEDDVNRTLGAVYRVLGEVRAEPADSNDLGYTLSIGFKVMGSLRDDPRRGYRRRGGATLNYPVTAWPAADSGGHASSSRDRQRFRRRAGSAIAAHSERRFQDKSPLIEFDAADRTVREPHRDFADR